MDRLFRDLRFALRTFLRKPCFSLVAILAMALGIGGNTAIFSVVNTVLLRPLPYPQPAELISVWTQFRELSLNRIGVSEAELIAFREANRTVEGIGAYDTSRATLGGTQPERVSIAVVTTNLLDVLGAAPRLGRNFRPEEERPGAERGALISEGLWKRRFNGDASILGKTLRLDGTDYPIVGVLDSAFRMPTELQGGSPIEALLPMTLDSAKLDLGSHSLETIARLRPGVDHRAAQAELLANGQRLELEHPDYYPQNSGHGVGVTPLHEDVVGGLRSLLLVLLGAVGMVLLIACANVANLLLARAEGRQREIAIRTAIGASRGRIARQLLTESVLLALLGGAVGLLLGMWGTDALLALSPRDLPRASEIGVDPAVLGFTALVSIVTGLLFGLAPAFKAARVDLHETLKESGRGTSTGRKQGRLRRGLVVAEVALALVLSIGAALLIQSFRNLRSVDTGFRAENVLTVGVPLPAMSYPENHDVLGFFKRLLEKIEAVPGVSDVGLASALPLSGSQWDTMFHKDGNPFDTEHFISTDLQMVSPGVFKAMGIEVVRGRYLEESDNESAPGVVLINETMARHVWPGEDPIGRRVQLLDSPTPKFPFLTVVGIARDLKNTGLDVEPRQEMYVPYVQFPNAFGKVIRGMMLVVRTASPSASTATAIQGAIRALDPELPIGAVNPLEDVVLQASARQRFSMLVLGIFAAVALLLAAVGIFGIMSYAVSRRTRELGVRFALGAQRRDVLAMVAREGFALTATGLGLGLLMAFGLTRLLSSLLFGVSASDPFVFASVAGVLVVVAMGATYLPARRAMKVDPIVALRYE